MTALPEPRRDVSGIHALPNVGRVGKPVERNDLPFTVFDAAGQSIVDYENFLLSAYGIGHSKNTVRSYAYDLLLIQRAWVALGVDRNEATMTDVEDLKRLLRQLRNPQRKRGVNTKRGRPGTRNSLTGKRYPLPGYAASRLDHIDSVLRMYFEWLNEQGRGPLANPVRRSGRPEGMSGDPDNPFRSGRRSPGRSSKSWSPPRSIPDAHLDLLMEATTNRRDYVIYHFMRNSGPRAAEVVNLTVESLVREQSVAEIARKGDQGERTPVPADPVWFDMIDYYLAELAERGVVLAPSEQLWRTNIGPDRPISYFTLQKAFLRLNESLGFNYTLHDLRHTAAHAMLDNGMTLVEAQEVLGHKSVATTQLYTAPNLRQVVTAFIRSREEAADRAARSAQLYQSEHLDYDPSELKNLLES